MTVTNFALVLPDGTISRNQDFDGPAPTLYPAKGRWIPDTKPAYDPATQTIARVEPVSADAVFVSYTVTALDPAIIAARTARTREAADKAAIKALPIIKQFRNLSKADVVNAVQAAFPAGPQRDLIKVLALAVWRSTVDYDPTDN